MNCLELISNKESFLENLRSKNRASENTIKSYNLDIQQFIKFWQLIEKNENQNLNINQVLERFINFLNNSNKSSSSIARKISCLNSFKRFLIKNGIQIDIKLSRPYVTQKEPETLSVKEITQILDQIDFNELPTKYPLRDSAIVELLYATGICCSEIVYIEVENIDFVNKTITIRAKRKKERLVVFGKKAYNKLKEYLENERSKIKSNNEKLFLNHRNSTLTVRSVQRICRMFRQYLKEKQNLTPHKLRHSFATHMLLNGLDVNTLQILMGYKTKISSEKYLKKINKQS